MAASLTLLGADCGCRYQYSSEAADVGAGSDWGGDAGAGGSHGGSSWLDPQMDWPRWLLLVSPLLLVLRGTVRIWVQLADGWLATTWLVSGSFAVHSTRAEAAGAVSRIPQAVLRSKAKAAAAAQPPPAAGPAAAAVGSGGGGEAELATLSGDFYQQLRFLSEGGPPGSWGQGILYLAMGGCLLVAVLLPVLARSLIE